MHVDKPTLHLLAMLLLCILALVVWIVALRLLMEVTSQLLDTLAYIVEIAHMS